MSELTRRYQQELRRTRSTVADHLERQWRALPDHRDDRIDPFLNTVLPVVRAGQARAVALTSAYLSQKTKLSNPIGLDTDRLIGAAVRNGIDPADVYKRPFVTTWSSIEKIGYALAIEKGLSRLRSTAEMDIAMSARDALLSFGEAFNSAGGSGSRIVGWVRVADPACCDFCQMLDGVRTGPSEPQPLHNNCGCTADPIEVDSSNASGIDSANLTPGDTVEQVRIEEHGEMGPLITDKADDFTSFADLPESYRNN